METYELAKRIRIARLYAGLSQSDVARLAGLHNVQISKLERGISKDLTGSTLRALCRVLGCTTDYILGLSDTRTPTHEDGKPILVG
jgi:transcriptional regulator with XRE-family HTH domain